MTLTLPIVVGKKYVRGDGEIVEITRANDRWAFSVQGGSYWVAHGGWFANRGSSGDFDLVADYIEPAKGHPHAALMAEFAKDAAETETPWDRWEVNYGTGDVWYCMPSTPAWCPSTSYRRKPTITPDPHAQNAAEYAKDMAETGKAWKGWEMRLCAYPSDPWQECNGHPTWSKGVEYRRKGDSL